MSDNGKVMSPYERRVQLVAATISENSKVGEKAAAKLAVHVLQVLDHIPEKMR